MVFQRATRRLARTVSQDKTRPSSPQTTNTLSPESILQMQQTIGNRAVGQLVAQLGRNGKKNTAPVKKKKKRGSKEAFEDDSDFETETDDEKDLTEVEQMQLLITHGKKKRQRLLSEDLDKNDDGDFLLHSQRARKVYAAHRSSQGKSMLSNVKRVERFQIGKQFHNIANETGYFITPGGNERPEGVTEPPSEYAKLLEAMRPYGKDPYAKKLYKLQTNEDLKEKDQLEDPELGAILLYYLNHNASDIHDDKLGRTQFIEHASKFAAITNVAELSRSMQSDDTPFDVTLLIKQGLIKVISGEKTLKEVFFQGTKGKDSIFLGAPTDGGAMILKNPLDNSYRTNLQRQMRLFPKKKREFKASLKNLKSSSKDNKSVKISDERLEELRLARLEVQVLDAKSLLEEIRGIKVPKESHLVNDFINDGQGDIKKYTKRIESLKKQCEGNEGALAELRTAATELNKKQKAAMKNL